MDENIISQFETCLIYNKPIPYKELNLYPVKMSEYMDFFFAVNCLTIEKNKIADVKIIQMSYLDFLFHLMENDTQGDTIRVMFSRILSMCLKIEPTCILYRRDEKEKIILIIRLKEEIKNSSGEITESFEDYEYDRYDFEKIKNIILHQNIPSYDDTYIDPKVDAVLKDAQEFMNKHKKKMASLEDQIICVLISTGLKEDDIFNLTIRKFAKILQRVDYKLHYEIYKTAEMSGNVTFKEEIAHWMSEIERSKYADVIVDNNRYEQLKTEIQQA